MADPVREFKERTEKFVREMLASQLEDKPSEQTVRRVTGQIVKALRPVVLAQPKDK
jgi:hypothetical protein